MTRSSRDPDAYDRIRDDALTTEAARIAELEARLAAAEAKHEQTVQRTTRQLGTLADTKQRLELQLAAATGRERKLRETLRHFAEPQNWEWDVAMDRSIWIAGDPMRVAQNALAAARPKDEE